MQKCRGIFEAVCVLYISIFFSFEIIREKNANYQLNRKRRVAQEFLWGTLTTLERNVE